jgi:Tol biopolymer transport system component
VAFIVGGEAASSSGQALYVIPSGGGQARKLAPANEGDSWAAPTEQRIGWNRDSTLVGYITYDLTTYGREQAWAIPVAEGDPLLITSITYSALGRGPTYEHSVQWSPDDKWVVVGGASSPFRLLRWPLSTVRPGDVRDLPGGEPEWSPDSRTLLFTESLNGALSVYDVIKEKAEPFVNEQQRVGTGLGEYANGPRPRFSPASSGADSDPIAYCSRSPQGEPRVAIRRRGSRELLPLPGLTNNPAWSPSGDRLVVETGQLQDDPLGPRWIPDGLAIAVISSSGEHTMSPLISNGHSPTWGK